jgi:hypothetical protein
MRITERWVFGIGTSILGPVLRSARKGHRHAVPTTALPEHVRQYLGLDTANMVIEAASLPVSDMDARRAFWRDLHDKPLTELGAADRHMRRGVLYLHVDLAVERANRPTVPRGTPAIRTFRQLLRHFDAESPARLNRRIYKDTACGASISIQLRGGDWIHNGSPRWEELTGAEPLVAFTIQTIVEGSDAEVNSAPFVLPVATQEVTDWMTDMEAEADQLWHEANMDEE